MLEKYIQLQVIKLNLIKLNLTNITCNIRHKYSNISEFMHGI